MFRHFSLDMEMYIFENYKKEFPELTGKKLTDALAMKSLSMYGCESGGIGRTKKGKPYPIGCDNVHISVSHSGNTFVCLIGSSTVGVDIQQERKVDIIGISRRYFSPRERDIVDKEGAAGFFRLWTRKEAYAKYRGNGLGDIIAGISVTDRNDVLFIDFQIEMGMYCSCCVGRTG